MSSIPPRKALLVLTLGDGRVLGHLPPIDVATPWWQDARPIVEAAREAFGLEVVILRLLGADLPRPPGGQVSYLAEVAEPLPDAARERLAPWTEPLLDDPLRLRWAVPGGPHADLQWASGVLQMLGLDSSDPPSRFAPGTCRASGDCRYAADRPGSRSCRHSSPTRATSFDCSRAAQCRASWGTIGIEHSLPRFLVLTGMTPSFPLSSRWCHDSSRFRQRGSAERTNCSGSACPTGVIRHSHWRWRHWSSAAAMSFHPTTAGSSRRSWRPPETLRRCRCLRYPGHDRPRRFLARQRPR